MKVIVLSAAKRTRLQPLTDDKPKGVIEVDGEPILTHCRDELTGLDAETFVVVGYLKERILDYYGDEEYARTSERSLQF